MAILQAEFISVPFSILCRGTRSHGASRAAKTRRHILALVALALTIASPFPAGATGPEGQVTWGVHVSLAPTWFDPAEMSGIITPYMVYYALHDGLVKAMPGQPFAPSLAKSWTASDDGLVYEFILRDGVKFHNGEPVTAEDVKFSYERYRGAANKALKDRSPRSRPPIPSASSSSSSSPGRTS
jgi:peptide/nickel transport system substrate-binding protein